MPLLISDDVDAATDGVVTFLLDALGSVAALASLLIWSDRCNINCTSLEYSPHFIKILIHYTQFKTFERNNITAFV